MNVKFRMPKLLAEQIANPSGNGKSRGIVRELLLTTIANYLFQNIANLERVSDDTLFVFFNYLTTCGFNADHEIETSNEHIFNSSQDSWRTLSDKKFLSNVQDFYNARALCERQQKEWVYQ